MMAPGGPPLVLASGSPTRRALLGSAGLRFTTSPAPLDEAALKASLHGTPGPDAAQALADAKAALVVQPGAIVIAADQLLELDGAWLAKPASRAAAREQLQHLRGRTHHLHVAITCQHGATTWRHRETAALTMRRFTDAFLDAYLDAEGGALLGCAGAYRLEGRGAHLFERVQGGHTAILGLPLAPLLAYLRSAGAVLA